MESVVISTVLFIVDLNSGLFAYTGHSSFLLDPYLLVTVYSAARYGIVFGLMDALLNVLYQYISIISSINSFKISGINQIVDIFLRDNRLIFQTLESIGFVKYPVTYLLSAFLFGLLRDIDNISIQNFKNEILERETVIFDLNQALKKHKDAIDDLKEKLTLENKGISILIEKLREIQISKPEDVYNEGIDLITDFIGGDCVSIYNLDPGGFLRLKVRKGNGILPNSLRPEDSVVLRYTQKEGISNVSVQMLTDEQGKVDVEPTIACLIKSSEKIFGFIVVEVIDPSKMNKNTEAYLKVMSDWFATMLASSEFVSKELEVLMKNSDGTTKKEYYQNFYEDYFERWKRFGMPFSVLEIKASEEIFEDIKKIKRNLDMIFTDYHNEPRHLTFLLGVCDSVGLSKVLERTNNKYNGKFEIIRSWSSDEKT